MKSLDLSAILLCLQQFSHPNQVWALKSSLDVEKFIWEGAGEQTHCWPTFLEDRSSIESDR